VTTAARDPRLVGPNAVIQMAAALRDLDGDRLAARVFGRAGLARLATHPPDQMIDQSIAARLHAAVRFELPEAVADQVAREAGRRTGAYILAHRIPAPVQWLLRLLPAGTSGRMLLQAVSRHAWTFAGSGVFSSGTRPGGGWIEIGANPLAMAPCHWHMAVFETLFARLLSPRVRVRETACCGDGAPACRFELDWE
jgi:divinyl protochlorophyllide a 8-vinyl-reductase